MELFLIIANVFNQFKVGSFVADKVTDFERTLVIYWAISGPSSRPAQSPNGGKDQRQLCAACAVQGACSSPLREVYLTHTCTLWWKLLNYAINFSLVEQ